MCGCVYEQGRGVCLSRRMCVYQHVLYVHLRDAASQEREQKTNSISSMQREEEVTERQSERVGGKVTHPCAHWRREGESCVWVCAETGACFTVYNLSVLQGN